MKATIDSGGRLLLPKALRDSLGIMPGSVVDISPYNGGLHITPGGRTARLVEAPDGGLVAVSDQPVTDDVVFALIDAGRR